jgi:hypothetical protein
MLVDLTENMSSDYRLDLGDLIVGTDDLWAAEWTMSGTNDPEDKTRGPCDPNTGADELTRLVVRPVSPPALRRGQPDLLSALEAAVHRPTRRLMCGSAGYRARGGDGCRAGA